MPVNSLSGSLSTAVYFASMFLLLFAVASPVRSAYQDSDLRAAQQITSGIAAQIDNLSPGMESVLSLRSSPGVSVSVLLSGSNVTTVVDGESAASQVRWSMEDCTLQPGQEYTVTIEGVGIGAGQSGAGGDGYLGVVETGA